MASIAIAEAAMSSQIRNSTAEVAVIGFIAFEAQEDLPVYSQRMKCGDGIEGNNIPPGFTAIGVFLFFGGTMASLAATTLLLPRTPLDRAVFLPALVLRVASS